MILTVNDFKSANYNDYLGYNRGGQTTVCAPHVARENLKQILLLSFCFQS